MNKHCYCIPVMGEYSRNLRQLQSGNIIWLYLLLLKQGSTENWQETELERGERGQEWGHKPRLDLALPETTSDYRLHLKPGNIRDEVNLLQE